MTVTQVYSAVTAQQFTEKEQANRDYSLPHQQESSEGKKKAKQPCSQKKRKRENRKERKKREREKKRNKERKKEK